MPKKWKKEFKKGQTRMRRRWLRRSKRLLVTHANNILHSSFSKVELYINSQQTYNSNGFYGHKFYVSNNFNRGISEYKGVLHWEGYDYEDFPDKVMEAPLSEPFFTRRMKTLCRHEVSALFEKIRIDPFYASDLLYPIMKVKLQLTRARPDFSMISDNPNVSFGVVDCSIYTRRIALKDVSPKKKNRQVCTNSCGVQLLGNSSKDFHHLC